MKRRFFATPAAFRRWLSKGHARETELWVGFHKRGTGTKSITWPEAVDEALCVGWIDGLRRGIDAHSYEIRFTRRKASSHWSHINVARVAELTRLGRMTQAGLDAFALRRADRTGRATHEQKRDLVLPPAARRALEANAKAHAYFDARPPWYRRAATWWVISAKKPETRARRLARLIDDSAHGRDIGPLRRKPSP